MGAKRFSFLAPELQRIGYDVQVVAGEVTRGHHSDGIPDASLPLIEGVHRCAETRKLPIAGGGMRVRAVNAFWRRVLGPIDWELFWIGPAVRAGIEVAWNKSRGVVIATVPPRSAALAGLRISRRLGWPFILDYRDPWSGYPWPAQRMGRLSRRVARRIETLCVGHSAARVFNTPEMREWFEKIFPKAARDRHFVIPNGIDALAPASTAEQIRRLEVVHAGAIYIGRSLIPVLRAIARLTARNAACKGARVITYGHVPDAEHVRIRVEELGEFLEIRPRTEREALMRRLQQAHVLLAVSGDDMTYSIPHKIYDYLAAGRPILAVTPRGTALHRFVSENDAGVCVDPGEPESLERALETLLCGRVEPVVARLAEPYLWSNLSRRYSEVIDTVCDGASLSARAPSPRVTAKS